MLEDLGGVAVRGYRASTFSITQRSLWALEILCEEGFAYDSSIAPLRHDRYGIPDAPREPHERCGIFEFPVSVMRALGLEFPLGGGFFRLFPLRWTSRSLRAYEARGQAAMLYLNPWELDPGQPRVKGLKLTNRLRHYARLGATAGKLEKLLQRHSWGRMDALVPAVAS
jgi:polysaccharide deacetylase family protein (PEP-CTERM system associated)